MWPCYGPSVRSHIGTPVYVALGVLLAGLVATPLTIMVMRSFGVMDVPNHRSSHSVPTVRGAGVGVAGVAVSGGLWHGLVVGDPSIVIVAAGAGALATVGFIDDVRGLSVRVRLPLQLAMATVAVYALGTLNPPILTVLAVVAVVAYLNAFNFMDGINGISGLHAGGVGLIWVIAGAGTDMALILGGVVAAAALAFLPFNLPIARGFLGDAGSYFFGGWLGLAAIALYGTLPWQVIAFPLAPYGVDVLWTLARRVSRGAAWHEAHREHAYQRLVAAGWSHTRSASLVGALTIGAGAAGLLLQREGPVARDLVAYCVVAVMLGGYLALPSIVEGRHMNTLD
jgi:UDP-GlcNAc:undecaprenyl-phosphate GlcNAc-1-phosphate transferase